MRLANNVQTQFQQRGIALMVVLWMLILLTLMAGSYSANMRTESLTTARHVQTSEARAIAEAGIWLAVKDLHKTKAERLWSADGTIETIDYLGSEIRVRVQDEAGKIDLNTAREALLRGLLQSTDIDEEDVNSITHAILDWRDRDKLVRLYGAEDTDYELAGLDYGAKDGPFNSIEELRLVMGMTEAIFQNIRPALTVHSHLPGINPRIAVREALLALPDIDVDFADEFISSRNEDNSISMPDIDKRLLSRAQDKTFQITSEGFSADSMVRLDVVIMLKTRAMPPFSVLSWQEGLASQHTGKTDEL